MDVSNMTPHDGEVYALGSELYPIRAEFVETKGSDGAAARVAWRLYDRFGRGILLTSESLDTIYRLQANYEEKHAK